MSQRALFIAILAAFLSSGCAGVHLTGPMPSDIGGEEVVTGRKASAAERVEARGAGDDLRRRYDHRRP